MRRIPRPSRPIDLLSAPCSTIRPRIAPSSPCVALPLRSKSAAPFSSSSRCSAGGLMDSYKSKRKHQAFVRKWQKRLLGESEPIGAHVDPYDATSPVRIAPEEMGGEEEVLDEEGYGIPGHPSYAKGEYVPAETGEGLERVGGKRWRRDLEELEMRDLYREVLGRDVETPKSFDVPKKGPRDPELLGSLFHQAVVEVYTLKQAEKELDLARYPHQGRYEVPSWIHDTPIHYSRRNGFELGISEAQTQELLNELQSTLPVKELVEEELVVEEVEEPVEKLEEVIEEVAVAKEDAKAKPEKKAEKVQKKPFDFMANRQFPKSLLEKESTPVVEEVVAETVVEPEPEPVLEVEQPVQPAEVTEPPVATETLTTTPTSRQPFETIYSRVPLTDPAIKFALAKRLTLLTGHRLPDPALHTTQTLGDLFTHLLETAKPKPSTLHKAIVLQRRELKAQQKKTNSQLAREGLRRKESLLDLPNVKISGKKLELRDREREVGRWKVIEYALVERGLPVPGESQRDPQRIIGQ